MSKEAIYTSNMIITLTDNSLTSQKFKYSLNGEEFVDYPGAIYIDDDGKYTLDVCDTYMDENGTYKCLNVSNTYKITIDSSIPDISHLTAKDNITTITPSSTNTYGFTIPGTSINLLDTYLNISDMTLKE